MAWAQPSAPISGTPVASASRTVERPTLDGDVLGDAAWAKATPISSFTQEQPDEGQPVSEGTEVRVIFTNDALYIGAVMYKTASLAESSCPTPAATATWMTPTAFG